MHFFIRKIFTNGSTMFDAYNVSYTLLIDIFQVFDVIYKQKNSITRAVFQNKQTAH